jgi:integrase
MSTRPLRIPRYRRHSSGQARVTLDGKDYLLGAYGSAASGEAYERTIAEWLEKRGRPPAGPAAEPIHVNKLVQAFFKHATAYYGFESNARRGDRYCLRDALRVVKRLYGRTLAKDFGPLALKACRTAMIDKDWSRTYINAQIGRVKQMFRWGAEEELIPGAIYQNLRSVPGLRAGKGTVRETKKVRPIPQAQVDAVLPFLTPTVAALVRLQLLTGCRPAEACLIRPLDIDMSNPNCWLYRPQMHKTEHYGQDRIILIGPRGQKVLRPFLGTNLDAYCFNPSRSETRRHEQQRLARKSPLTCTQRSRKPNPRRRRAPGDRYDTHAYRRAIHRACDRAFPLPEHLSPRRTDEATESRRVWWARLTAEERIEVKAWRREHRWSVNRLRHNRATELRTYGLDIAKTVLGHTKVETTQIYAEKDVRAAMELMTRIG